MSLSLSRRTLPLLILVLGCFAAIPSRAGIGSNLLIFTLPGTGAQVGTAVAVAGDVNGDGYSDLIVGAPHYSVGQEEQGQVLLFLGGPNGYATTPAWTYKSNITGANLGQSVAPAGDVNGDGYADVIVGAPNLSSSGLPNNGRAYVFLGGPSGLASTPAWTFDGTQGGEKLGWSVCTAGDVNGDSYDDVIVGSPNYGNITAPAYRAQGTTSAFNNGRALAFLGSASGLAVSPSWVHFGFQAGGAFGFSVSTAGDINGDGYDDVIVGAPYGSNLFNGHPNAGEIDIFHGGPSGLPTTPSVFRYGTQANELHGYSVAAAGDVDGDGYAEVVVGSPGYTDVVASQGAVYIYPGSDEGIQGASFIAEGPVDSATLPGGQFGYCVAPAGDINGDGYADFVAGAPFYSANGTTGSNIGYMAVYEGTTQSNGQLNGYHARLAYSTSGGQGSEMGASVCAAGDGNGDGFGDVVVGAPTFAGFDGTVIAFGGAADAPTFVRSTGFDYSFSPLGFIPVAVGDIDGDGYTDLAMGLGGGAIDIHRGGAGGVSPSAAWSVAPSDIDPTATDLFVSLGPIGDVNGDGYDDLLVETYPTPRYLVVVGGPSGPVLPPFWTAGKVDFLTPAGDINGDGYADLVGFHSDGTTSDTVRVYLGGPAGMTPSTEFTIDDAQVWSSFNQLGDYDGDGYDDVLISSMFHTQTLNQQGAVWVYRGSASGLNTSPAVTVLGTAAGDEVFGNPAGDLNGDGLADFDVHGHLTTYVGYYYGNSALPPTVLGAPGDLPSAYGDFNGDGFDDMITNYFLQPALYLGSAAGLSTIPSAMLSPPPTYPWESRASGDVAPARADFNGDGFADGCELALTYPSGNDPDSIHVLFTYGNAATTGAPGLDRAARQRRSSDTAPIGLQGLSDSPTQFRLASRGRSAAGRTRVRMESDVKNWGVAFASNLGNLVHDAWSATGAPGINGTFVALDAARALPTSSATDKWRMRIAAHSPYFPWTPWLSPTGNGRNEYDLRNASSVAGVSAGAVPVRVELAPPSPNPSRGEAHMEFALPRRASVELGIYDLAGRRIATLARGPAEAGPHEIAWSGRTDSGRPAGPGLYFARLTTEGHEITQKIVRTE